MKKLILLLLSISLFCLSSCDIGSGGKTDDTSGSEADSAALASSLTVTVKHTVLDAKDANAYAYYAAPTAALADSEAADRLNGSETLTDVIAGAKSEAEAVILCAEESPEWSEANRFFSYNYLTHIGSSEAALCYGYMYTYHTGGVHPIHGVNYYTFELETGKTLTVADILDPDNKNAASELEAAVIDAFYGFGHGVAFDDNVESIAADFVNGDYPTVWSLESDALCLTFSPYMIADYAAGYIELSIAYDSIPGVILEKYIPAVDTSDAVIGVYSADSEEAAVIDRRFGEETDTVLIIDGTACNVTVRSQYYYGIVFYASRIEDSLIYLEEGDTYTVTYNNGETAEFTV